MPYKVIKKKNQFFVENKMTGRVMGRHSTEEKAMKQMMAIHANEKGMVSKTKVKF